MASARTTVRSAGRSLVGWSVRKCVKRRVKSHQRSTSSSESVIFTWGNKAHTSFSSRAAAVGTAVFNGLIDSSSLSMVMSAPLVSAELMAQVEALSRRQQVKYELPLLQVADLTLDSRGFKVTRGAMPIVLRPREFRLLAYLMRHENQVVNRAMLLEAVWGGHFAFPDTVIDVQISRLRSKVDKGFSPALIPTILRVGYLLGARG